jgi:hypothetical protein
LLKIISLSPKNLGVQRCPFFILGASQDAWTPFWLKAWMGGPTGWEAQQDGRLNRMGDLKEKFLPQKGEIIREGGVCL